MEAKSVVEKVDGTRHLRIPMTHIDAGLTRALYSMQYGNYFPLRIYLRETY